MNEYTASNGMYVEVEDDGLDGVRVSFSLPIRPSIPVTFTEDEFQALREFFRAEEDEHLGAWTPDGNPEVRIIPDSDDENRILVFSRGLRTFSVYVRMPGGHVRQEGVAHGWGSLLANEYFTAHPEPKPKPWHDAKEGEVWLITYDGNEYPAIFQAEAFRDHGGSWNADVITDARRIWPES